MTDMLIYEKPINPRLGIELAIIHHNPDISDKDLLNLRERIFLDAYNRTSANGSCTGYARDYYLYSRKVMVI